MSSWFRDNPPAANGGTNGNSSANQDQIFDDVLPLKRRQYRKNAKDLVREEEEWRKRPQHLNVEKEQSQTRRDVAEKTQTDQRFPGPQNGQANLRRDLAKAQRLYRPTRKLLGGRGSGKKLQDAEP